MNMCNGFDDTITLIDNQRIYRFYRERLINLALAQFIWEGDVFDGPNATCDADYFERRLLFGGQACMCKPFGTDEWLSLGFVSDGTLNVYRLPTKIMAVGGNCNSFAPEEWEILFDNKTRKPIWPDIDMYARLLAECHMIFRSNLLSQNQPYVLVGSEYQKKSFENIMMKIFSHVPYLLVKKQEDADKIKVLNTDAEFNGNELLDSLDRLWRNAISILGIAPATTLDKKERVLNNEVELAREEFIVARGARELSRQQFCRKMKAKHGIDISVHMCSAADIDINLPTDMAREEIERANHQLGVKKEDDIDE